MGKKDPLVKRYFLTPGPKNSGVMHGQVITKVDTDHYLVDFHDWIIGALNHERLMTLAEMKDWQFFRSPDAMGLAYKRRPETSGEGASSPSRASGSPAGPDG